MMFAGYVLSQIGLTVFAAYIYTEKMGSLLNESKSDLNNNKREGFADLNYGSEDNWNGHILLVKTTLGRFDVLTGL